jgi:hypothetical protein
VRNIVDLDSKSAATIFSAVVVERDNPTEELGPIDLENHISQAIWKIFDRCRSEAAERLQVNEVDLLLTDARVLRVRIDGHEVINPHGFTGRQLEVLLMITMVRRDKFVAEDAFMLEGGSVRAYLLSKQLNLERAVYIEIEKRLTTLFAIMPERISYLNEFEWGSEKIKEAIANELGVADEVAWQLYLRYAANEVSAKVLKKMEQIFYDVFNIFVSGDIMSLKNFLHFAAINPPPIYVKGFFPLPESVFRKRFAFNQKRIRFLAAPDFSLAEFVNDDIHRIYQELNQLAKRRIKWLMPTR